MRKKINLWKLSVGFFVITLLYALRFLYKKTIPTLVILLLLTVAASVFYLYCTKQITLSGGYTVLQARRFYRSCMEKGLSSRHKLMENQLLLQEIVKNYDFADKMDPDDLWQLYCDGKSWDDASGKQ